MLPARSVRGAGFSSASTAAAPSPRPQLRSQRSQLRASASGSSIETASADYAALQQHDVFAAATGEAVRLPALWSADAAGRRCVVACLTHFADLSSTELAQKLVAVLPEVRCRCRCVCMQHGMRRRAVQRSRPRAAHARPLVAALRSCARRAWACWRWGWARWRRLASSAS